jgi:hypothetical protein
MSRNQNKTISCNSNGIIVSYGDAKKHQFMRYERINTPTYVKNIQLYGTVKYQQIEKSTKFTPKQNELFAKLLYGFKMFSYEEINLMPEETRLEIKISYAKAHRILSKWKQDITFTNLDRFLLSLFPKSPIVKAMVGVTGHLDQIEKEDEISFRNLGLTDTQIADKLIEYGLLPKNFYNLA